MTTLFVRHQVNDYPAWRKAYDAFGPIQKRYGVVAESVYKAEENPNDITVTHDFESLEKAKAFVESSELKDTMAKAGVKGTPTFWFTSKT